MEGRAPPPDAAFPTRVISSPRAGFFKIRSGRNQPWVPARIRLDFGSYSAEVAGRLTGDADEDPMVVPRLSEIWEYGREITEDEYQRMLAPPPAPSF